MMHTDRSALLCDLAETYQIYDIKAHPASRVALFAAGLRDNSRIKMKLAGLPVSNEMLMLAQMVDRLSVLIWQNTKDGEKGRNKPESLVDMLLSKNTENVRKTDCFDTPEAFWAARSAIIERTARNG